jgi:hypothetical protein
MQSYPKKKNPTIGCCGIDCGLCPRYHADGTSRCPGCAGQDFQEKHPSCSILTCCLVTRSLETCGGCEEFVCRKIKNWDSGDSFVTHRICLSNLKRIKENGLAAFLGQQKQRLQLLAGLLEKYDDGRSKSFYCLSAAFLPIEELRLAIERAKSLAGATRGRKETAALLRETLVEIAARSKIELSYRNKT